MPSPRLRRSLVAALSLLGVLAALPATSSAAAAFSPCKDHRSFECATVTVPLDRTGRIAGTVPLHVERQRGTGGRSTAFVGLAGGPGQSAADLAQGTWRSLGAPVAGTDQIVTFDQRGTGQSGLIDCRGALRQARSPDEAAALCGAKVGNMRPFFTTSDSVADLDAVRQAIGADKVVLVGVSYGTYVALRYARAFPSRVAAMVLDSTVPLQGADAWDRSTYAAIPGVLRKLCADGACPFTRDPVADLRTVAARLQSKPRGAVFVTSKGRRTPERINRASLLFGLLMNGDFSPQLRAYVPGALASARAGDWAPLVRLVGLGFGTGDAMRAPGVPGAPGAPRTSRVSPAGGTSPLSRASGQAQESDGLYYATTCTDTVLPWAPSSAPSSRGPILSAASRALPLGPFQPFSRETVLETSTAATCFAWPATAAQPYVDGGVPIAVPTLLLSGGADLRTPTSDALLTQAVVPGSTLVTVGGVGHYVLGNDPTGCGRDAYRRFLTGQAIEDRCDGVDAAPATLAQAPTRLGDVATLGHAGTPGRVARVAARTMVDALASSGLSATAGATVRIGGLRGGRITATFSGSQRVTLHAVEYLRGIKVSGTATASATGLRATLRVDGGRSSRRGTVRIVDDRLTATIGGRRISSVGGKRTARTARSGDDQRSGPRFPTPGIDIG